MNAEPTIIVNGEPRAHELGQTVAALLAQYQLIPQRVAVEVNERLVPRTRFGETMLHPGDRVEIVTLVGGG